jgi:hypothetical protein
MRQIGLQNLHLVNQANGDVLNRIGLRSCIPRQIVLIRLCRAFAVVSQLCVHLTDWMNFSYVILC